MKSLVAIFLAASYSSFAATRCVPADQCPTFEAMSILAETDANVADVLQTVICGRKASTGQLTVFCPEEQDEDKNDFVVHSARPVDDVIRKPGVFIVNPNSADCEGSLQVSERLNPLIDCNAFILNHFYRCT